jgi:arylsulfatase A-like enzyme
LAFLCASFAGLARVEAADRPNVLWLIGEDFSPDLGCYGTPEARTPNIDALAAKGVRFTKAFSTAPVCSASRSAFMTGMYQTTIGAHNHRSHRDDDFRLPEGVRVLPHWLRDAGIFAANIVQLADDRDERFYRGTGKTDWNFNIEGKPFESNDWSELKSHQPFYAQINFSETHRGPAWNAADKNIDHPADPTKVKVPPYYPDHPLVREDWAQYLNSAMALDKKIGFVLKRLEEDGLADNTVVFFFGDHGQAMPRGKQWCYDSGLRIPLIVYVPPALELDQASFKIGKPGSTDDRLVEAIDFAPTTLALMGVAKPQAMQGHDLLSRKEQQQWRDAAFGARDRCDETVFHIRTVRTPRYRYIRNFDHEKPFLLLNRYKETSYPTIPLMRSLYAQDKLNEIQARLASPDPRPEEELYDLENDPYEINNLASSSEHAKVLKDLRARLDRWVEESNDQGRTPEPASLVRKWHENASKSDDTKLKKVMAEYPDAYPLDRRFLNETWLEK